MIDNNNNNNNKKDKNKFTDTFLGYQKIIRGFISRIVKLSNMAFLCPLQFA